MSGLNYSCCKTQTGIIWQRGSDMAESTEVVVRRFTQVIDVSLQIQGLVKVDA